MSPSRPHVAAQLPADLPGEEPASPAGVPEEIKKKSNPAGGFLTRAGGRRGLHILPATLRAGAEPGRAAGAAAPQHPLLRAPLELAGTPELAPAPARRPRGRRRRRGRAAGGGGSRRRFLARPSCGCGRGGDDRAHGTARGSRPGESSGKALPGSRLTSRGRAGVPSPGWAAGCPAPAGSGRGVSPSILPRRGLPAGERPGAAPPRAGRGNRAGLKPPLGRSEDPRLCPRLRAALAAELAPGHAPRHSSGVLSEAQLCHSPPPQQQHPTPGACISSPVPPFRYHHSGTTIHSPVPLFPPQYHHSLPRYHHSGVTLHSPVPALPALPTPPPADTPRQRAGGSSSLPSHPPRGTLPPFLRLPASSSSSSLPQEGPGKRKCRGAPLGPAARMPDSPAGPPAGKGEGPPALLEAGTGRQSLALPDPPKKGEAGSACLGGVSYFLGCKAVAWGGG